jgi:nucleoside-diphosphate-sugar epimerase
LKTLLTGASGFLGYYLKKELREDLVTLGRSSSNTIICRLDHEVPDLPTVDLVVHNAGWAHRIPRNPEEESRFYQVNLFGTKNLLTGLEKSGILPKAIVFISTVAVYGIETGNQISERTEPKPQTPYAKSKHEAELLLQGWTSAKGVNLTILRLPLVAGAKNTPGNLGAMIRGIKNGYYFKIGSGNAKKSIVLASDVASLIPSLLTKRGVYNLTDGDHPTIAQLESYLGDFYGKKIKKIPNWLLKIAVFLGDRFSIVPINSYRLAKLSDSLTFDDSKARKEIGWNPSPVIGNLDLIKK